jgi:hypothetical protein
MKSSVEAPVPSRLAEPERAQMSSADPSVARPPRPEAKRSEGSSDAIGALEEAHEELVEKLSQQFEVLSEELRSLEQRIGRVCELVDTLPTRVDIAERHARHEEVAGDGRLAARGSQLAAGGSRCPLGHSPKGRAAGGSQPGDAEAGAPSSEPQLPAVPKPPAPGPPQETA